MKERFQVVEVENQIMTLKINRSSGCSSCNTSSGCGASGMLANYVERSSVFSKPLEDGVVVGDWITLEISSSELFARAFMLYIFPIFALFIASYFGQHISATTELWQIGLGSVGFLSAILLTKYFVK